jgi:hypothetical protein
MDYYLALLYETGFCKCFLGSEMFSRLKCFESTVLKEIYLGALSLGVKQLGHEADHSPPSSAKVNAWSYTSTPPICLHGMVLS